jgi:TolB protein
MAAQMYTAVKRVTLSAVALALLSLAAIRIPAWQAAVPMSRPGQEDLTFWVNHNGLEQLDVIGEVGFGDMARILMRRRANADAFRKLRDRFTFPVREMNTIQTPDAFRAEIDANGLTWRNRPERFVIAAAHTFNLPIIVTNSGAPTNLQARFIATTSESSFSSDLPAGTAGYFLAGRPLVNLHVQLVFAAGRPAAARVYLTGADGLAYVPRGHVSRITAMSAEYYFHGKNAFDVDLPAGRTLIEATRGPEYEMVSQSVDLAPGKPASVSLVLKRWENMAAKGWYSSDAHIHANYTADHHQVINAEDVRLQAQAEDLNNANLMVANSSGAFIHDAQYFEGRPNALSTRNYILYWNEEMRNNGPYGHMSFFNLKSLVYPLHTGHRNTANWEDYPANYTQAEAAEKQGGAVTYVHPAVMPTFEGVGGVGARELPVDLALGQVDAIDVMSNNDEIAAMQLWYRLLNCGFRLAISAGTDSFTNVADHYTAGGSRVYVHSGRELHYGEWVAAYKRGRSFASNGPTIGLTVDGKEPGDEIRFPASSTKRVRVQAMLHTQVPVDKFEIVVNGKPALTRDVAHSNQVLIDEELSLEHSSWIAARAIGPWHRLVLNDVQTFAHTSPVYVNFGDERVVLSEDARFWIEWIDKLIAQVNERGHFSTLARRQEVIDLCRRGQEVYRGLLATTGNR